MPVGDAFLAPHGGDAFEDDAAHERDAHTKAGEGERGVRAHLDATSIESHGENGEDRADCEASDAGTVKSGLGVGVGVHRRNPFLLVCSSFDNKDIRGCSAFCIYELPSTQTEHNRIENMNCPSSPSAPARLLLI